MVTERSFLEGFKRETIIKSLNKGISDMAVEEGWGTAIATVREGGKVTIPKTVRDFLKIIKGDTVELKVRKL